MKQDAPGTTTASLSDLLLDALPEGVLAHDGDRKVTFFNRAAERITGYRRKDVVGRDCHEVFPGGLCGPQCVFWEGERAPAEGTRYLVTLTTKQGGQRQLEVSSASLRDGEGGVTGCLMSFRDITRIAELGRDFEHAEGFSRIVGCDHKMLLVFDLIRDVAPSRYPVLIQGESGTGKELVAAALHRESPRAAKLFVPVNCAALPESILESELFGHVKGAFTGALRDKKGRFELADGGTIFLDEIGELNPAIQVKLLRVLEEGAFERVGGEKTVRSDVRVVSATNKDLKKEIDAGRFREDLYYRLCVVPIMLPPLRERRGDIPLLAERLLARALAESKHEAVALSPEAIRALVDHRWPGNVRELQNAIQFALIKCKGGAIGREHLPPNVAEAEAPVPVEQRRRKLSAVVVEEALRKSRGNKVKAADLLGVSRATLYRFLAEIQP